MKYFIVGLGNPGDEYADTRHNTGRMMVQMFAKHAGFEDFEYDKKSEALVTKGKLGKHDVVCILPETFMNKSGVSAKAYVTSVKAAGQLVVVYDDFQLPLGRVKMSYDRSSGGHNGLESIIKAVKTTAFTRIRVGLSKTTAQGVAKVPHGPKEVEDFILSKFKKPEIEALKVVSKVVNEGIDLFVTEGRDIATMRVNSHA